jgi:hypothetical protein
MLGTAKCTVIYGSAIGTIMGLSCVPASASQAAYRSKCLVNALTGIVCAGSNMSGDPTYQESGFDRADCCRKRVADTLYQTINPTMRPMTTVK